MLGCLELSSLNLKVFLEDLEDGNTAKDFLLHIAGLGYSITELREGMEVKMLPDDYASILAKRYWATVFLTEYQNYGEFPQ